MDMHRGVDAISRHLSSGAGAAPLVLALDQGTTNAKALLVGPGGGVLAAASRPVGVAFPAPGWVEQDATEIRTATVAAAIECLARAGMPRVAAIALSTQRESAVAWHAATGRPLGPVLGWQDARTAGWCREIPSDQAATVSARTGLHVDPMYSAPKMRWLLDAAVEAGVKAADVRLGTIDTWLVWNLAGELRAEAGNASRTLLLDLATVSWDQDLLQMFGIPRASLAPIVPSAGSFGSTIGSSGLPVGVPIVVVLGDSHAAMYAHGCTEPGQAKATYGTGSSVMTPVLALPERRPTGLSTTLAWMVDGPVYAYEGNIVASGAALEWMGRTLGLTGVAELTALAGTVDSAEGVSFVPAFAGLAAPYWDRDAVGTVTGITSGSTRAHLARAAIDSVAHQVADVVDAVDAGADARMASLAADGGATASSILMQAQADVIGRPVTVSATAEASAMGAALLALSFLGERASPSRPEAGATFVPSLHETKRRASRDRWRSAVARARTRTAGSSART